MRLFAWIALCCVASALRAALPESVLEACLAPAVREQASAKRWQVLKAKFDKAVREECGERDGWYRTDFDKSDWQRLEVPGLWTIDTLAKMDGVVWTTTQFDVPEELTGKEATLYMGMIDDDDVTWVNGQRITPGQEVPVAAGAVIRMADMTFLLKDR